MCERNSWTSVFDAPSCTRHCSFTHSSDPHSNLVGWGAGLVLAADRLWGVPMIPGSWYPHPCVMGPLCLDVGGTCSNQRNAVTEASRMCSHFIETAVPCLRHTLIPGQMERHRGRRWNCCEKGSGLYKRCSPSLSFIPDREPGQKSFSSLPGGMTSSPSSW